MRIRTRLVTISALCVLLLGGCPSIEPPPPPSPFPAGIYSGEPDVQTDISLDGEVIESRKQTEGVSPRTVVINARGQQESINGEVATPGFRTEGTVGPLTVERVITGIVVSARSILTTYDATMTIDGVEFTGFGEWVYRLRDDGDIDYSETMTVGASVDGDFLTANYELSGVLLRR